jgi:hypothetical protein
MENEFCVFSVCTKFCSSYSHYTLNFIPCILVISSISFHELSVYGQFHSANHPQMLIFSEINHYSVYYQYALNFIPCIISMRLI